MTTQSTAPDIPTGTGYGRPKPTCLKELVEVDAGTPMGEYFRRHWHPIAIAKDIAEVPVRARLLAENLVVFRDKRGRIGVVDELCAHRQASLYYGRIEEGGIRCAYHGWMFDTQGHCVDQAVELGGGRHRDKVRQAWYPTQQQYGLVFVYMGPPDKMPLLPRFDILEGLGEDEELAVALDSLPGADDAVLPTNWLLDMDNIHDMGHAMWLHQLHSGPQFGEAFHYVTKENAAACEQAYEYVDTPHGIFSRVEMPLPDGTVISSILETHFPLVRFIQPPPLIGQIGGVVNWCVPRDNVSHLTLSVRRVAKGTPVTGNPMSNWDRSDPAVVRAKPSDHEMQMSAGPIQMHSLEHLAVSDRGMIRLRRRYRAELEKMAKGEPLMNAFFEPGQELFKVSAGSFIVKAAAEDTQAVSSDSSLSLEGRWDVKLKTPIGEQQAAFKLCIEGGKVTGTVTNAAESVEVQDGIADGRHLSWTAKMRKPVPMKFKFTADIDGTRIAGRAKSFFGTAEFSGHWAADPG